MTRAMDEHRLSIEGHAGRCSCGEWKCVVDRRETLKIPMSKLVVRIGELVMDEHAKHLEEAQ